MTAPSDASRRPRDAGLFTVMRRAGPRNVSVPSAQSRYARVPTNSQSRSLIRNRRVLYQLLCAVSARDEVRSVDYAEAREDISVSNASMKFKALWIEGFILRRESTAESGGLEHVYSRIA
jgi:hypothetical protein